MQGGVSALSKQRRMSPGSGADNLSRQEPRRRPRGRSPRSNPAPLEEYEIEDLADVLPDDRLRETIHKMGCLNRGSKATSESARSAAKKLTSLMSQTGREHKKLERAREAQTSLEEENKLLKETLGCIKKGSSQARRSPPPNELAPPEDL